MASIKHFQQLDKLHSWRQKSFVLGLVERNLPNLLLADASLQLNLPVHPQRMVDALWEQLLNRSQVDWENTIRQLEQALEILADYEEYGARPAEVAIQLLLQAIELTLFPQRRLAQSAAKLSFECVTEFVEFSEGAGLEEHDLVMLLERHPLVKNELNLHRALVKLLRDAALPQPPLEDEVRKIADQEGVSNLGISLEESS